MMSQGPSFLGALWVVSILAVIGLLTLIFLVGRGLVRIRAEMLKQIERRMDKNREIKLQMANERVDELKQENENLRANVEQLEGELAAYRERGYRLSAVQSARRERRRA